MFQLKAPDKKTENRLLLLGSAAWFGFAVALILYYIFVSMPWELHADYSDTILWAQASYESGKIFDPDFCYACFLPFGGQLLMLPFMGALGYSIPTLCGGMAAFTLLLAASLVFLLRSLDYEWRWSLFLTGTMLLLLCSSAKLREIFYGHVIYYSLGCLFFCIGAGLFFRARKAGPKSPAAMAYPALLLLFSAATSLNGMMTMTLFNIPFLAAALLERLLEEKAAPGENRRAALLIGLMVAGCVIGYGIGAALRSGMVAEYADSYSRLSKPEEWAHNLERLFPAWMKLTDPILFNHYDLFSLYGIGSCVCIAASVLLIVLPVVALIRYRSFANAQERTVLLFQLCLNGVMLFLLAFGRLSDMYWRLSPLVFSAILTSLMLIRLYAGRRGKTVRPLVWRRMAVLVALPLLAACLINAERIVWLPNGDGETVQRKCISFLREQGLDYGYATVWNAAPITLASGEEIKVRNILVDESAEGGVSPDYYQTNIHWYEDVPGQERYFLLLTAGEVDKLEAVKDSIAERAMQRLTFEGYTVLVYGFNPLS